MKPIVAILFVALLAGCGSSLISYDEFNRYYLHCLEKEFKNVHFAKNIRGGIVATGASGRELEIEIDDLYFRYKQSPDSLNAFIRQAMKDIKVNKFGIEYNSTLTTDDILPVIRSAAAINKLTKEERKNLFMEKYNDSLYLVLMAVRDDSLEEVPLNIMQSLFTDFPTAKATALSNLEVRTEDFTIMQVDDGVYILNTKRYLSASLIFVSQIWDENRLDVLGEYVVAMPGGNGILVTGSFNNKGLTLLKSMAVGIVAKNPHPISVCLFKYDGKKFQPYGR